MNTNKIHKLDTDYVFVKEYELDGGLVKVYGNIKNPVYFVNGLRIPDEVRRNYLNDDEKLDSLFHKSIKLLEKKLESLPTERIKKEIKNGGNNVCK